MKFERLFSPIDVRGCVFPNRIMSTAAVTRLAAEDGHITEALISRYQRMARGGLGAMVVEAAVVLPSRSSFNLRISDDSFVDELRTFADRVRSANPQVKIGLQLIHFLKLSRSGWRQKVEDLKPEEIRAIPEQFAGASLRAKHAGFDFVECHMAHFTTLASFLSLRNKRADGYGGDFEGRVRLPAEVITATRSAVGDGFPVGIRMNGEEFTKEGNTLLQTERVGSRFASLAVDYISVSAGERFEDAEPPPPNSPPFAGTGYSGYRMSPRWWHPDGVQVYLAEGIRAAVRLAGYGTPVVTAGKIRTPELAERILAEGKADIIGIARAILCDPDWPEKARQGRSSDIVKCAACGFCSDADERYERVTCIQWPKGMQNALSSWLLVPPCTKACPAGLDIRGYIELIGRGHYDEALELIMERIPLPGVVGRVCPRFCEAECNRAGIEEPVAINALKRFVADRNAEKGRRQDVSISWSRKEKVAVIGSGPAGLSAAYYLARFGYRVTIFESASVAGGMMAMGIPEFRLPRDILREEIGHIQKAGVEISLNSRVGKEGLTLAQVRAKGYKAIFVAVGAHKKRTDFSFLESAGIDFGPKWIIRVNPRTMATNQEGVFAGGDVVSGRATVVEAIAAGRRAAVAIDRYLCGEPLDLPEAEPQAIRLDILDISGINKRSRERIPCLKQEVRPGHFRTVEQTFSESSALREADRCLQCGMFPKKKVPF